MYYDSMRALRRRVTGPKSERRSISTDSDVLVVSHRYSVLVNLIVRFITDADLSCLTIGTTQTPIDAHQRQMALQCSIRLVLCHS